jgi:hypothetical protein
VHRIEALAVRAVLCRRHTGQARITVKELTQTLDRRHLHYCIGIEKQDVTVR